MIQQIMKSHRMIAATLLAAVLLPFSYSAKLEKFQKLFADRLKKK